jgi:hypothetical protein
MRVDQYLGCSNQMRQVDQTPAYNQHINMILSYTLKNYTTKLLHPELNPHFLLFFSNLRVFLVTKSLWGGGRLGGKSEIPLLGDSLSGIKRKWYVCFYIYFGKTKGVAHTNTS